MSEHLIRCLDCGAATEYERLVERKWECDCGAQLHPKPSLRQITFAESLQIEHPDKLNPTELSAAIEARLSEKEQEKEQRTAALESRAAAALKQITGSVTLATAPTEELLKEIERRGHAFIILIGPPGTKDVRLLSECWAGFDAGQHGRELLHRWCYYAANGQVKEVDPQFDRPHAAMTRPRRSQTNRRS